MSRKCVSFRRIRYKSEELLPFRQTSIDLRSSRPILSGKAQRNHRQRRCSPKKKVGSNILECSWEQRSGDCGCRFQHENDQVITCNSVRQQYGQGLKTLLCLYNRISIQTESSNTGDHLCCKLLILNPKVQLKNDLLVARSKLF